MNDTGITPIEALIVAIPETAGSALYGMIDILSAAGTIWQSLVRTEPLQKFFNVRVMGLSRESFRCENGIPVIPDVSLAENPAARILILPELWLGPDEVFKGRYPEIMDWIRKQHRQGVMIYAACSGVIMLAETGLLDGREATSHWGYQDLFRKQYPQVRYCPEPNLVFSDPAGRIVTAGGTTSWHDLAIHIISRHANPGEALRIAKVYLLKLHGEGQLPYVSLVRNDPHADSIVRYCQQWLREHFMETDALAHAVVLAKIPERTLKRRFKTATGLSLIEFLQNIRVEHAKALLEQTETSVDEISIAAGYEDASFFRRLFKRSTGLTPSQYRRMFQPMMRA